jgi:hypothetical protein
MPGFHALPIIQKSLSRHKGYIPEKHHGWQKQGHMGNWGLWELAIVNSDQSVSKLPVSSLHTKGT